MADEALLDRIDTILDNIDEFWAIDVTDDLVDSLVLAYTAGLADSATYIAELKGLSVGVSFNVTDPEVIEFLKEQAAEMVRNVNNGTRFYLRQMISTGFQEGVSEENLIKSILEGLFDVSDFSENRVRSIARFEITKAQTKGWIKQLNEVGVKTKVWKTVGPDACPTCQENEAMGPQPVNSKNYLTVFAGEKTDGPPAHPNLERCHLGIPDDELDKMGMSVEWYTGAAKGKSEVTEMGGKGSGHWRHRGRKGKRGGSAPSTGGTLSLHQLPNKVTYLAYKGEKPPQGKGFLVPGGEAYARWLYDPRTGEIIFNITQPGEMPIWHANMLADAEGALGTRLTGFDKWVRGTISGNELGFLGVAAGIGAVEVDVAKSMRNIQHAVRHAHSIDGIPDDFTVVITFGAGRKAARMKVGEL